MVYAHNNAQEKGHETKLIMGRQVMAPKMEMGKKRVWPRDLSPPLPSFSFTPRSETSKPTIFLQSKPAPSAEKSDDREEQQPSLA